jgi:hypothetical protein
MPVPTTEEEVMRLYSMGNTPAFIANRLGFPLEEIVSHIAEYTSRAREEKENGEEKTETAAPQECPTTTRDSMQQVCLSTSVLLSEATTQLLALSHALCGNTATDAELIEFLVEKSQSNESDNPFEHLADTLSSEYIIIKRSS